MRHISWDEYYEKVKELDRKLQDMHSSKQISLYPIPRGGLLVATLLSYLSSRYCIVDKCPAFCRNMVLVDDILETGATRESYKQRYSARDISLAVLFDKSGLYENIKPADVSVEVIKEKQWIVLPYENENDEIEHSKEWGYNSEKEG